MQLSTMMYYLSRGAALIFVWGGGGRGLTLNLSNVLKKSMLVLEAVRVLLRSGKA